MFDPSAISTNPWDYKDTYNPFEYVGTEASIGTLESTLGEVTTTDKFNMFRLALGTDDPTSTYESLVANALLGDRSGEAAIKEQLIQDHRDRMTAELKNEIDSGSLTSDQLLAYAAYTKEGIANPPDYAEIARENFFSGIPDSLNLANPDPRTLVTPVSGFKVAAEFDKIAQQITAANDHNTGEQLFDIVKVITPFLSTGGKTYANREALKIAGLTDQYEKTSASLDFLFSSRSIERVRNLLQTLPDDQAVELLKAYATAHNAARTVTGEVQSMFDLNEINPSNLYTTFDKVVNNAMTTLDILGVGIFAKPKKFLQAGSASEAALKAAVAANPGRTAEIFKDIILGGSQKFSILPEAEGTFIETLRQIHPKTGAAYDSTGKVDGAVKQKLGNVWDKFTDTVPDALLNPFLYNKSEQEVILEQEALRVLLTPAYLSSGIKYEKIFDTAVDTAYSIVAEYGKTPVSKFADGKEAIDFARNGFTKYDNLELVAVNSKNGATDVVDISGVLRKGDKYRDEFVKAYADPSWEFSIRQTTTREFDSTTAHLFGVDRAIKSSWLHHIPGGGRLRGFLPPTSRFSTETLRTMNYVADQAPLLEKTITDDVARTLNNLGDYERNRVLDLLEHGADTETVFKPHDLAGIYSKNEIAAYYSFRQASDLNYVLDNIRLSKDADALGFTRQIGIYNQDNKLLNTNIVVRQKPETLDDARKIRRAVDPVSNQTINLTKGDIEAAYANGGGLFRRLRHEGEHYVFLKDKSVGKLTDRQRYILPYREGIYKRYYKDEYVIRKTVGEGLDNSTAYAIVGSKSEAAELVRIKNAARKPGSNVFYKEQRIDEYNNELQDINRLSNRIELENLRGLRHRGDRLEGFVGKANVEDPMRSLLKATGQSVNSAIRYEWLMTMLGRMKHSYPELFKEVEAGAVSQVARSARLPDNVKDLVARLKSARHNDGTYKYTTKDINKAVELFEMIQDFRGLPGGMSKHWQNAMLTLGDWLDDAGLKKVGKFASNLRDTDPLRFARKAAFISFISTAFVPMMLLQLSQALLLPAFYAKTSLKNLATGLFVPKLTSLVYSTMSEAMRFTKADEGAYSILRRASDKLGAVTYGVDVETYRKMIHEFIKTGFPSGLNEHALVEGITTHVSRAHSSDWAQRARDHKIAYNVGLAGESISAGVGNVNNFLKAVGFDAGETGNLLLYWTTALESKASNFPGGLKALLDNKKEMIALQSEVRNITGQMNRAGRTKFQGFTTTQGSLGDILNTVFQFTSTPYKMFMQMMPEFLGGSTVLSPARKAGVLAFGTAAMGYSFVPGAENLVNSLYPNLPVDERRILAGGFLDYFYNRMLYGDSMEVSLSARFSPTQGVITMKDKLDAFRSKPLYDAMKEAIPAASVASRTANAILTVGNVLYGDAKDLFTTEEKFLVAAQALSSILSSTDNAVKAYATYRMEHAILTSGLNVNLESDTYKAILRGFGIKSGDELDNIRRSSEFQKLAAGIVDLPDAVEDAAAKQTAQYLWKALPYITSNYEEFTDRVDAFKAGAFTLTKYGVFDKDQRYANKVVNYLTTKQEGDKPLYEILYGNPYTTEIARRLRPFLNKKQTDELEQALNVFNVYHPEGESK